ncbi:MAG: alpha/beta fold hydrolase [Acidobacteriota bacterium]
MIDFDIAKRSKQLLLKMKGILFSMSMQVFCFSLMNPVLFAEEILDKSELMYYQDENGNVKKVEDPAGWEKRRASVLDGIQKAMGRIPDMDTFPPLDPIVEETVREDSYTRQKLTLQVEEGDRLSCFLMVPDNLEGKVPAVLALHPTHPMGKSDTVGLSGRENRNYGQELARLGFVVLVPDYPSFGEEVDYDFGSDNYLSGSMKGIVNHMRCVDYLVSLPYVDPDNIGVIGHSLGGHNAMFAAVFDQRFKAVVSSCGWTPFHDYYQGKIKGWTSQRYMPLLEDKYHLDPDLVPFDFYGIIAALAPRPFLSVSPLRDSNFDVSGVRKGVAEARLVYELLGAGDNLLVEHPDSEHDFIPEMRQEAYSFLAKYLCFNLREH